MKERRKVRTAPKTKVKGCGTACLPNGSSDVVEGTAYQLKGKSSAGFLYVRLTSRALFHFNVWDLMTNRCVRDLITCW